MKKVKAVVITPILNTKAIKTEEDFLEGDFDDLFILNKSGMMDEFEPSLHLVDKARKKLEEGAIQNVIREGEKGRERTITELENREIVSSVQQERQQQQKEGREKSYHFGYAVQAFEGL